MLRLFLLISLALPLTGLPQIPCELALLAPKSLKGTRSLNEITELKIGSYNVLNLEHSVGKYKIDKETGKKTFLPEKITKNPEDVKKIAKIIQDEQLDIVILQEVEGFNALEIFNQKYLGGQYEARTLSGNDNRGITIAFLIKKDLPIKYKLRSSRDTKYLNPNSGKEENIFSRDIPILHIWNTKTSSLDPPEMVIMGNHLKSQRDRAHDPKSILLRTKQIDEAVKIIKDYERHFPSTPVIFGGDFNANLITGTEFRSLKENGLMQDAFDIANPKMNKMDRVTHSFHPRGGETSYSQMDGMFINNAGKKYLTEAKVYRYKVNGEEKRLPKTYAERETNPSDHFPVIITVNSQILSH